MNYIQGSTNTAKPIANNVGAVASKNAGFFSEIFNRFWAVLLVILILFILIVIYYKTVGYYMDMGWKRLWAFVASGGSVKMEVGPEDADGEINPIVEAELKPIDKPLPPVPAAAPMAAASQRPLGMPGATDSSSGLSSIFPSMAIGGPQKEVFNVSRNIYTFNDAAAVCSALNSELATYEQIQKAYEGGADWCNYGWVKGQMAVYPTQKATWDKLQKGAPEYRSACGQPGVNGGYFDNPDLRFGVNCFGVKPAKTDTDELNESSVALPQSAEEIEFEKRVQRFRDQLNTLTVLPFSRGKWTE